MRRSTAAFDQAYARWCGQSICAVLAMETMGATAAAVRDPLDDAFREWDAFVGGGGDHDGRDERSLDDLTTLEIVAPRPHE